MKLYQVRYRLILFLITSNVLFAEKDTPEVEQTAKKQELRSAIPFIDQEQRTTGLNIEKRKGLQIVAGDGTYSMNLRARIQARFTQDVVPDKHGDDASEFQIRRARLSLRGNTFNPNWRYYIQLGFSNRDEETSNPNSLRDAVISYAGFPNFQMSFGQMKIPFSRQRVNSSGALQLVDRSLVNGELNLDRDVGFSIASDNFLGLDHLIGYSVGIFGGDGRNSSSSKPGMLGMGRIFLSPFGKTNYLSESDFERSSRPRMTIGTAFAYNANTKRARSTFGNVYNFARFDYQQAVADIMFKWYGFSFTSEFLWRKADRNFLENSSAQREYSRSAHGYFIQTSYLLPFMLEGVFRYGELRPLAGTDPSLGYGRELGGGLAYYLDYHDLKLNLDYFELKGSFANSSGLAHEIRFQIQMFI